MGFKQWYTFGLVFVLLGALNLGVKGLTGIVMSSHIDVLEYLFRELLGMPATILYTLYILIGLAALMLAHLTVQMHNKHRG